MILSKDTRDYVKENTILKNNRTTLLVKSVSTSNWGKRVTYKIIEDNAKDRICLKGRTAYGVCLSELYGLEIVEQIGEIDMKKNTVDLKEIYFVTDK